MAHEFIKHLKEDHKKQKEIAAKLIEGYLELFTF